jgi:hypothetical protein
MSRASWLGTVAQWGSALVSVLALVMSAGTAYFVALRQTEELRVTVDESRGLYYDEEHNAFRIGIKVGIIFVNSGNQSIVIRGARVGLNYERTSSFCSPFLDTGLETFVLKEKEIAKREVRLRVNTAAGVRTTTDTLDYIFAYPPDSFDKNNFDVGLCMVVGAATPTESQVYGRFEFGHDYAPKGGFTTGGGALPMYVIWRRSGTIFDN